MVGITAVATIAGIILVQTVITEAEEDLRAKVSQLESKFTVLTHRLQDENEKLTQRLQEENEKLTQRLQAENEKLTQRLQEENEKLTQRLQHAEERMSGLQNQDELLKKQLENVTDMQFERRSSHFKDAIGKFKWNGRHEMLTPNRRQSRSTDPDEVVFSAELSHELNNVPIHTTIRFDFTVYMTGNSYDSSTGVFTCPTSGLYLFAVFIETLSVDVEALVSLKMDGKTYMSVISERSDSGEDDTGGNVVLLPVNKGQRVWVETHGNDNQSFWKGFTTFSGVLIYRN